LLPDDLVHRQGETRVERGLLERPAGFARLQKLQQVGRPRQAPDMGGKNSLCARLHARSPYAHDRAQDSWEARKSAAYSASLIGAVRREISPISREAHRWV
jgi:hypothetical protein